MAWWGNTLADPGAGWGGDGGGGGGVCSGDSTPPPLLKNNVKGFNPKYKIIS